MSAVHPSVVALAAQRLGSHLVLDSATAGSQPSADVAPRECAVDIGAGLRMHLPAHPHPNTYVRLTREGIELGRWTPEAWDLEGDIWLQEAAADTACATNLLSAPRGGHALGL